MTARQSARSVHPTDGTRLFPPFRVTVGSAWLPSPRECSNSNSETVTLLNISNMRCIPSADNCDPSSYEEKQLPQLESLRTIALFGDPEVVVSGTTARAIGHDRTNPVDNNRIR